MYTLRNNNNTYNIPSADGDIAYCLHDLYLMMKMVFDNQQLQMLSSGCTSNCYLPSNYIDTQQISKEAVDIFNQLFEKFLASSIQAKIANATEKARQDAQIVFDQQNSIRERQLVEQERLLKSKIANADKLLDDIIEVYGATLLVSDNPEIRKRAKTVIEQAEQRKNS
jgi:hypothetical protein